jgi:hypothetical protein
VTGTASAIMIRYMVLHVGIGHPELDVSSPV